MFSIVKFAGVVIAQDCVVMVWTGDCFLEKSNVLFLAWKEKLF